MAIPEKAISQGFSEKYGPTLALRELTAIQQEIEMLESQLSRIRNDLQKGDLISFSQLKLDTSKEKVINGVPGAFEGIDFGSMLHKGQPDLVRQKKVLREMLKGNYRVLDCLAARF